MLRNISAVAARSRSRTAATMSQAVMMRRPLNVRPGGTQEDRSEAEKHRNERQKRVETEEIGGKPFASFSERQYSNPTGGTSNPKTGTDKSKSPITDRRSGTPSDPKNHPGGPSAGPVNPLQRPGGPDINAAPADGADRPGGAGSDSGTDPLDRSRKNKRDVDSTDPLERSRNTPIRQGTGPLEHERGQRDQATPGELGAAGSTKSPKEQGRSQTGRTDQRSGTDQTPGQSQEPKHRPGKPGSTSPNLDEKTRMPGASTTQSTMGQSTSGSSGTGVGSFRDAQP